MIEGSVVMKIIRKVFAVFFALAAIGAIGNFATMTEYDMATRVSFIFTSLLCAFISYKLFKAPKKKSVDDTPRSESVFAEHISGLDIGEEKTTITLTENGLKIAPMNRPTEFDLSLDKINSINTYDKLEVEKYVKSSLTKSIIGGVAFGLPGALAGAAPTEKKRYNANTYLVIDYSDGDLLFSIYSKKSAKALISFLKELKPDVTDVKKVTL